ncbi:Processing alpha-1 [Hyphodiscus hymeniophilus]|uniref:alpha-1,2-Mannosidase n=1 Tax=Hyphodiscus hymeniophilus TaxID=353542 RepID=A0A9P6VFW2_9HELO|nr:Processing alpha-1 [Hyphodiscus hymeniophilus]
MLRMLRFRRYRVFLAFAAVFSLLLLRYSHTWDYLIDAKHEQSPIEDDHGDSPHPLKELNGYPKDSEKPGFLQMKPPVSEVATQTPAPKPSSTSSILAVVPTLPHVVLPHRTKPGATVTEEGDSTEEIHPIGQPGRQELPSFSAVPTTIHWERQVENWPVPTESLIRLPTGAPVPIPKIQHVFNDETPDAKINREKRQNKVREEFQRAWNGYKSYAWLHDELSPVSGKFRDPFCSWAATLVDTLDTLWIMGLQEEFEEAARAVDLIDFTTSPRSDIPVFETTIRYLGGLLAAYDVSGGIYKNLLEKAVELADILMGAFDTPNRMPVLFYRWKPTFASQPHRASQRSNTAELGSLAMEFTRLAQLTKEPRYYDAIARITNALYEWQERGTQLDGVFPDSIDASGCNRSVPLTTNQPIANSENAPLTPAKDADPPHGYEPSSPKTVAEPKKKGMKGQEPAELEVQIAPPTLGQPSKAKIVGWDDNSGTRGQSKRDLGDAGISNSTLAQSQAPATRDAPAVDSTVVKSGTTNPTTSDVVTDPVTGLPIDMSGAKKALGNALSDWDCTPQGLDAGNSYGRNKFSMGGGQDSTYEYFPKQYLLLSGREEKYKQMYIKTIDAVRKWMLYRPMVPGDRDILFSGLVTTFGEPEKDLKLTAEVEHLTCFIGGMIGMGAKIFGLEGDLELAIKLADGCVWAYEATPSGIMPEGATVLPCESAEQCTWNETAYWEFLDPMFASRDQTLADYIVQKEARDAEKVRLAEAVLTKADQELLDAKQAADVPPRTQHEDVLRQEAKAKLSSSLTDLTHTIEPAPTLKPVSLRKRQFGAIEESKAVPRNFQDDVAQAKQNYKKDAANDIGAMQGVSSPSSAVTPKDNLYMDKTLATEVELRGLAAGRQAEVPLQQHTPQESAATAETLPDPMRPLSHKEYVEKRIAQEALPPGYVTIRGRKYILRPEAIESVWYMYRITGDPTWQDKGWNMFESIIKHTSSPYGHSAIYDVTVDKSEQIDEMESFWLAETLKYFYLLYSTPETISLDEWVLNTEAHPFKREVSP